MIDGYAYCRMIFENNRPQDFIYLAVNKSFEELTGLKQVTGKKVTEVIPGIRETNPELFEIYGRVALTGQSERFETYLDPLKIWFSVSVFSPEKGTFTAVFENITEHKKAADSIQTNEVRLESLLRISQFKSGNVREFLDYALDEAIKLSSSKIGYIYFYDEETEEFTLNTWSKEVMQECSILNPETIYKLGKTGIWGEVVRQRKPFVVNDFQTPNPLKKGYPAGHASLWRWMSIPIFKGEKIIAVVGIANKATDYDQDDIRQLMLLMDSVWKYVEREQLQEDLRRRTAELEASNRELESFSYTVSHDLRAPLRSMDGFSQALLEDYSNHMDEQGKQWLNNIRDSSQRMGQLIDDILGLSRVIRTELKFEKVDLSYLARSVAENLKENEPERQVEFVITPGIEAIGDNNLIALSLQHLLANAFKFTSGRPNARIEFGFSQRDTGKVYFVTDNGAGFDMKYVDKLFQPFQRLHSNKEYPGTGIGLVTVQRIIQRHGGEVWAEGEVNKGATFYFTLNRPPSG
jgi:signal transduction histidine kinase